MARDALSGQLEPGEPALEALLLLSDERIGPDESARLVQLHDPAQPRLERRVLLVHVVAVQPVRHLQPQGIAGPEPAGNDAFFQQGIPQPPRAGRRNEHFEAVLARIACPGDDAPPDSRDRRLAEVIVRKVEHARLAERIDQPGRPGALDRDLGPIIRTLRDRDAFPRVRPHPVEVLVSSARVHAGEQPLRGKAVDDDVVDHAALLVAEGAVLRLPVLALREVVGDQPLRGLQGARSFQRDLPHVRDVEHAGGVPHRRMLLEHPLVLDRHVEPRELHHPRGGGEVGVVEWSAQGHGSSSGVANLASGGGARKRRRERCVCLPRRAAHHSRAFVPPSRQVHSEHA